MHSSRMRTGHSLTICWSLLPRGGVSGPGGVWSQEGSGSEGVCSQGGGPGDVWSGGLLPGGWWCVVQGGVVVSGLGGQVYPSMH